MQLPRMARLRGARRMGIPLGAGLALLTLVAVAAGDASPAVASSAGGATRTGVHGPAGGGGTGGQDAVGETVLPGLVRNEPLNVDVSHFGKASSAPAMPALGKLRPADLFVVAPTALSPAVSAAVRRLSGVTAALPLDAARIDMDGKLTATLGVDPAAFRVFAAGPTARSAGLWQNVAAGGVAMSYTMGKLDKVPTGRDVRVTGRKVEELPLAGLGTVGIGGVDAVVSDAVARSLGMPAGNAIVISAPHADLSTLMRQIRKLLPKGAAVAPLVAQGPSGVAAASGSAGTAGATGSAGLSQSQLIKFLTAAESRLGMPYVWGAAGPFQFDCSGLVQWSLAQAGVVMPRVAADQALTGPLVPVSELAAGDLLFYHTDPTAPGYISHVAIYLGDGKMLQAPEPGLDVEVVPASFGSEFAGAIRVDPAVAAVVAGDPAG
ncbi:MAG TPA: C40 family peptidase [Streptosporangiaceae bacterium]|nr:C40 family peptidase [Streptosporangiaceae bacterium]